MHRIALGPCVSSSRTVNDLFSKQIKSFDTKIHLTFARKANDKQQLTAAVRICATASPMLPAVGFALLFTGTGTGLCVVRMYMAYDVRNC